MPMLSYTAKDFVHKLLTKDPQKRMGTIEALKHPFIMGEKLSKADYKCASAKRLESWITQHGTNTPTTITANPNSCAEVLTKEESVAPDVLAADDLEGRNYQTLILDESPAYDTSEIQCEGVVTVATPPKFEMTQMNKLP